MGNKRRGNEGKKRHYDDKKSWKQQVGDLWEFSAGSSDSLLIDFINITSWPSVAEGSPKASWLAEATGHVVISGETHTMGRAEAKMMQHIQ